MAPSTWPASPPEAADAFGLRALRGFYAWHAPLYDFTRPLLLFGRGRVLDGLDPRPGQLVLDVGCGTGHSLPRLARSGARVTAVEPLPEMRARAERRLARQGLAGRVRFDGEPYGAHAGYARRADRLLLSYVLSMMPPWEQVLERVRADLRPGGRLGVVDFLDARAPVDLGLRRSHVHLGPERLERLQRLFPRHRLELRRGPLWRYFLFWGEAV